jgi:TonB-linked SusC/RagA family outer membrane protein
LIRCEHNEEGFIVYSKKQKLHMKKKWLPQLSLLCLALVINFIPLLLHAQSRADVRGIVRSEISGNNLQGATVTVKNAKNNFSASTQTDSTGVFTFSKLPAGAGYSFSFSYVGYEPQTLSGINLKPDATFTLVAELKEPNQKMNEVVVIGYGTQRKKDITGSVVSVSEKTLDEVPANNLTMSLQGRAAGVDIARTGVRPGSGGQIRIRGNRSLSSSNEPLIVLDGFVYQGSINDLNTDDIANIDILKDASATAVYGSRGSNGVIIVTTKRGRTGKPTINYSGTVGITSVIDQYPVFNADEYYAFKSESRYGAGNATSPAVFTPAELEGKANGTNTNWQDLLYRKGFSTSHDLNVSGGTDLTQYGMGVSYLNQEGVIPSVGFKRFGLRATIDQKIGKRIKIGLNTLNTLTYTDGDNVNPIFVTLALSPLVSPYNPDGSVNIFPMVGHQDVGARLNPLTLETPNAVLDRRRRLRTFNTLYAELQILEGLKYRFNAGLDFRQDNYGEYYAANTILSFASNTPFISNTAHIANGEAWMYDIYHQLTYDKVIGNKHRLNATALYEVQEDQSTSSDFTGTGIPADYMQNTNFSRLVSAISAPGSGNSFTKSGILSYMGRINYTYNNRYSFTATVRRDGSSRLAEGNKWFTYPALGVSWSASDEPFLQKVNWLSTL